MFTRPKRSVSIKHFEELYHYVAGSEEMVAQILTGHLAVEFLLRKLINQYDSKLTAIADDLSHARLISLNRDLGTLSPKRASVLARINGLRNRYAHEIQYHASLAELSDLFNEAAGSFTDYAEGLKQAQTALASAANVHELDKWLLPELFLAIIYDLQQEYIARGGKEELP